jgi:hypothetical protein
VARAKRTDRAEARRRYRAYLAHVEREAAEADEAFDDGATRARVADRVADRDSDRDSDRDAPPKPGQSMGMLASMKAAVRQVHYREDLRYGPRLVTRTHAVWVPSAICIATAALAISRANSGTVDEVRNDAFYQMAIGFVLSPWLPVLPGLIAGFFAPRASWLAGALAAFVSTVAFGAVVVVRPEAAYLNGAHMTAAEVVAQTGWMMLYAVPFGAALAAFSAWYKRFLELIGPAGQRRAAARKQVARKQKARRR